MRGEKSPKTRATQSKIPPRITQTAFQSQVALLETQTQKQETKTHKSHKHEIIAMNHRMRILPAKRLLKFVSRAPHNLRDFLSIKSHKPSR